MLAQITSYLKIIIIFQDRLFIPQDVKEIKFMFVKDEGCKYS